MKIRQYIPDLLSLLILAILAACVYGIISALMNPRIRLPLWQYEYLREVDSAKAAGLPPPPRPSSPHIAPRHIQTPLEHFIDPTNPAGLYQSSP